MLNEIREYEEYACDLTKEGITLRLNYRELCNKLSGLERALVIIARRILMIPEAPFEERIEIATDALKAWLGYSVKKEPTGAYGVEFQRLRAWFPNYIVRMMEAKGSLASPLERRLYPSLQDAIDGVSEREKQNAASRQQEKLSAILAELPNKKSQMGMKLFQETVWNEENSFKALSYESVVATAIDMGPLREHFLYANASLGEMEKKLKKATPNHPQGKSLKKDGADMDVILKFTAAYLLEKTGRELYAPIVKANIANWAETDPKLEKKDLEAYIFETGGKNYPLFEMDHVGGNVLKIKLCPEWIRENGFVLDAKAPSEYRYRIKDAGAGRALIWEKTAERSLS